MGWSKGGKTEALLAAMARGCLLRGRRVGLPHPDGEMLGLPEPIRVWDWHLEQFPELRQRGRQATGSGCRPGGPSGLRPRGRGHRAARRRTRVPRSTRSRRGRPTSRSRRRSCSAPTGSRSRARWTPPSCCSATARRRSPSSSWTDGGRAVGWRPRWSRSARASWPTTVSSGSPSRTGRARCSSSGPARRGPAAGRPVRRATVRRRCAHPHPVRHRGARRGRARGRHALAARPSRTRLRRPGQPARTGAGGGYDHGTPPRPRVALVGADGAGKSTITRAARDRTAAGAGQAHLHGGQPRGELPDAADHPAPGGRQAGAGRPAGPRRLARRRREDGRRRAAGAVRRHAAPPGWWCGCSRSGCASSSPGATPGAGYLVVFDRHFFADYYHCDVEARHGTRRPAVRALHGWMLAARSTPSPTWSLCLDAPGSVLLRAQAGGQRRSGWSTAVSSTCGWPTPFPRFVVVDADRPLEAVFADVVDTIRRHWEVVAA